MRAPCIVTGAGLAALLLAGCAGDATRPARAPPGSDCVFQSSITGFTPVDTTRIVIRGIRRDDAYLAEVSAGCFALEHRWSLALVDGDGNGQICGFGRDSVAYRDLGRSERCRILGLKRLDPADLELIEAGHGARRPAGPPGDAP